MRIMVDTNILLSALIFTIIIEHASDDGEESETKKEGVQFLKVELQS